MNLARLNHVFVPATRDARDRLRRSFFVRIFWPIAWLYGAFSDEGRILSVLTLFVGTAGVDVAGTQVHLLWATLVGLLLASLLVRRAYRLDGLSAQLEAPRRVTAGETMRIGVVLDHRGSRPHHALRLRGPFLPWDGSYAGPSPRIARIAPGERIRAEVRARFVQRGPHHLDPFTVVATVPFALAVGPAIESEGYRFVVLPRPARIESLRLTAGRGGNDSGPLGASGRAGHAFELVGVRPYRRGDPVRDLHPKTWARVGTPHVREYRHPRHRHTALVIDPSATSERGLEAAISLAAGVAIHLARDRLDALVVESEVHPVERHRGGVDACLDRLAQIPAMPPREILSEDALARLPNLACALVVTAARDPRALALVERLLRRGIGCRLLTVHDGGLWRRPPPAPRHALEAVIDARAVERGEALAL